MLDAADEAFHAPGLEQRWSDSLSFGGGDGQGAFLSVGVERRPNEHALEGSAALWLRDGRFALVSSRERADRDEPRAGAVRLECVVPFSLWRVVLDGPSRLFDRPEDVARRGAGRDAHLAGDLTFASWTDACEFAADALGDVDAARHYEQPGSLAGRLRLGDQRLGLAGAGMRDHSWGVRDWQTVPWWRWIRVVLDPDTFLVISQIGRRDGGPPAAAGALMVGGELGPVRHVDLVGDHQAWSAHVIDEHGRETELDGHALSIAPLRRRRGRRVTHFDEVLTRLRWRGEVRAGVCEWLAQP